MDHSDHSLQPGFVKSALPWRTTFPFFDMHFRVGDFDEEALGEYIQRSSTSLDDAATQFTEANNVEWAWILLRAVKKVYGSDPRLKQGELEHVRRRWLVTEAECGGWPNLDFPTDNSDTWVNLWSELLGDVLPCVCDAEFLIGLFEAQQRVLAGLDTVVWGDGNEVDDVYDLLLSRMMELDASAIRRVLNWLESESFGFSRNEQICCELNRLRPRLASLDESLVALCERVMRSLWGGEYSSKMPKDCWPKLLRDGGDDSGG